MVTILSVSVDDKQRDWLKFNKGRKDCSPSFLLRRAIHQKMQEMGDEYFEDIKTMREKVKNFSDRFQKTIDFLNTKELTDEFLEQIKE